MIKKCERSNGLNSFTNFAKKIYYLVKPAIPYQYRIYFRKKYNAHIRKVCTGWPIDKKAAKAPDGWNGWPSGRRFALVLTHDVETAQGQDGCYQLAEMEMGLGFRSSFYFVCEDYHVSDDCRRYLLKNGFEVGVHGLKHNGNLFRSKKFFLKQVPKINRYIREWESSGFRAPSMYHNLQWTHHLKIEYDASTFDTDPFEPQPDGMGIIFPFWVQQNSSEKGFVELPYTLPQDSTLFVFLGEKNIGIWKRKLDWIAVHGGMALLNTHPDYMNFGNKRMAIDEYPVKYYEEFLEYIRQKYDGQYWHVLPRDIARFWKENSRNAAIQRDIE